jgi:hypothetical protein
MAVEIDSTRKAVNITWDADAIDAEFVDIRATNVATGDVSTRDALPNDGAAVLTYPAEFTGTSHVEVTAADTTESGDISPRAAATADAEVESGDIEVA